MRPRQDAIVCALVLPAGVAALTLVSCGSTAFSGDDLRTSEAGTGGTSATGGGSGTAGKSGAAGNGEAGGAQGGEGGQLGGTGGASAQGGASAGGSAANGVSGGEGGEAGGSGVTCDPTLAPEVDTCVIDEAYGVFVSPTGDDNEGDGSKTAPFGTFTKAIEAAAESGKRVYACEGDEPFAESVSIGADAKDLEIFGGFDCDDWTYDAIQKTSVVSPTPLALHIVDTENVRIEGVRFEAAEAALPGESSVGAFVVNSTGVVLRRVEIVAGDGVDGAPGSLEEFVYPDQSTLNGNPEGPAGMGGAQKACTCQGTLMSIGGVGGVPSASGDAGAMGLPDHDDGGLPGTPDSGDCGNGGSGRAGAAAPNALAGLGAASFGSIAAAEWSPSPGEDGGTGQPGQGGGGGASLNDNGHGGGGGCGGCGGNGATKGFGGGASMGLLVIESELVLENASITTNDAGDGGDGKAGQLGQQEVGAGGNAVSSLNSCPGGNGGRGGNGGASGGGAGGISVGIVWIGEQAPIQTEVTFELGTAGEGGIGGEPGVNDGINGTVQDVLPIP